MSNDTGVFMITGALKSRLDGLWLEFHSGGITNPLTVIEQISYLMFTRMLDTIEMRNEKKAQRLKKKNWDKIFPEDKQYLRWSHIKNLGAEEQLSIFNGTYIDPKTKQRQMGIFEFFTNDFVKSTTLGRYLKDAQFLIQKPSLLKTAINVIDDLPIMEGDTKGDLYEYLLGKLSTAGVAGQFRTPRHIIKTMVRILDPKPTETICDPACGTGGFLIGAMDYLKEKYTSPELVHPETDENGNEIKDAHGNPVMVYTGDLLEQYRSHIQKNMFHGFDFDSTMLRIAAMNMLLHGIDSPCIEYQDTLSNTFKERFPQYHANAFNVILANPPFKGSIDADSVHKSLTSIAKTKKTELLFVILMEQMLTTGGRCAVIVPDGVLFGSSGAHVAVRERLVEKNQLEAVISLPSGVFKPYAGVSTAILVFNKGGVTKDVFFYKVENDGYSLDDKRDPVQGSDLDDLVGKWREWKEGKKRKRFEKRTEKAFFVPKNEIVKNIYDLSLNRYKEVEYLETEYDSPQVILSKMKKIEKDILSDITVLEGLLK